MDVTVNLDDLLYVLTAEDETGKAVRAARKSLLDSVFAAIDLADEREKVSR